MWLIYYDLQKSLCGEIVFDDDFNNAKIYKIYNVLNDILCIGVICDTLKTCLFQYNKESKLKRNINDKFYNIYIRIYIHTYVYIHT